jgi:hypothetical protein
MSAYKKLKSSDIFTVPYVAHKSWSFTVQNATPTSSNYIVFFEGEVPTSSFDVNLNATTSLGEYETLVYQQVNHLFYQNYSGSLLSTQSLMLTTDNYTSASEQRPTSSYFIYNENPVLDKTFPTSSGDRIQVISIPKEIYGEKIKPGTLHISNSNNQFQDDGNGNLSRFGVHVGNIFYSHGLAVITNQAYQFWWYPTTVSFENEWTVYENYITCTLEESDFNLSYNPSLLKDPTEPTSSVKDFATGSVFVPYATTIGLYNDNNELLMVAKLAQPIPISSETDQNFLIRYDT